jgi:uncharacterized sulfatase
VVKRGCFLLKGDVQWALELVDHLLALDASHPEGRSLKAEALETLGRDQSSANGRNYYLSVAQELRRR